MSKNNIKLPAIPKLAGFAQHRSKIEWREQRVSYDWKAYSSEQLGTMEAYWDEFVKTLHGLLPGRFLETPDRYYGINLGTFNGAFQKAWMRQGFRMYGVELRDTVAELKEYGCEGEQASYYSMPNISDNNFDLAIMDRAIFINPDQGYYFDDRTQCFVERNVESPEFLFNSTPDELNPENRVLAPPYFAESFRILKHDGVFFAILYTNWTSIALIELFAQGEVSLHCVGNYRPFLAISVDRSKEPSTYLKLEEFLSTITLGENVDEYLNSHPYVGRTQWQGDGLIKFHYLLTNQLVVINSRSGKVLHANYVVNDADANEFFFDNDFKIKVIPDETFSKRNKVVLLLGRKVSGPVYSSGASPKLTAFYKNLPIEYEYFAVDSNLTNSNFASSAWQGIDTCYRKKLLNGCHVVIANALLDSFVKNRSNNSYLLIESSLENTRRLICKVQDSGNVPVVIIPIIPDFSNLDQTQQKFIRQYSSVYSAYCNQHDIEAINFLVNVDTDSNKDFNKLKKYRLSLAAAIAEYFGGLPRE